MSSMTKTFSTLWSDLQNVLFQLFEIGGVITQRLLTAAALRIIRL